MPKAVIATFAGNPPLRACEGVNAGVFRLRDSAVSAPSHRRHGLFPEAVALQLSTILGLWFTSDNRVCDLAAKEVGSKSCPHT